MANREKAVKLLFKKTLYYSWKESLDPHNTWLDADRADNVCNEPVTKRD